MSEHSKVFSNGDLSMRHEKYLENGNVIPMECIRIVEMEDDDDTVALDIYWGDELPYVEYDTYLYDNKKDAAFDGLELHILSLRKSMEKNFTESI